MKKQIYLYHYENHFDVITYVPSFPGKGYCCLECNRGYNMKEKHRCSKVFKCRFTEGCLGITLKAPSRECGNCQRMFAGHECFVDHCHLTKTASLCVKNFIKCKTSHTRRGSPRITCVEKKCVEIAKNMLTPILRCFMKPVNLKMI